MYNIPRIVPFVVILFIALLNHYAIAQDSPQAMTAREILREADKARGNLGGIEWTVHLYATNSKGDQEMTAEVKARGFDVLATALSPPQAKGNRLLLIKGDMWLEKPNVSKPIPITQRQKLMSNAAYGDISTTNYASDYVATLIGVEDLDGRSCWVYDLAAKHNNLTYDRIKYWVTQKDFLGIKAEYFTVSGQKWKFALMEYNNHITRDGMVKPFISSVRISSALIEQDQTVLITFSDPHLVALPDDAFEFRLPP